MAYGVQRTIGGTVVTQLRQSTVVKFDHTKSREEWFSGATEEFLKIVAEPGDRVILEYITTPSSGLWKARKP